MARYRCLAVFRNTSKLRRCTRARMGAFPEFSICGGVWCVLIYVCVFVSSLCFCVRLCCWCLCLSVCVCTCIHAHTCVHVHTRVCMYTCTCISISPVICNGIGHRRDEVRALLPKTQQWCSVGTHRGLGGGCRFNENASQNRKQIFMMFKCFQWDVVSVFFQKFVQCW